MGFWIALLIDEAGMEFMIALLVVAVAGTTLVMPWVNFTRINRLQRELAAAYKKIDLLYSQLREEKYKLSVPEGKVAETQTVSVIDHNPMEVKEIVKPSIEAITVTKSNEAEVVFRSEVILEAKKEPASKFSFEQQFGARLPVWIGGIALALAGFFLVKYSIEAGLLSPLVRIVLGIGFGFCLLATANKIRHKQKLADHIRIAQALAGAGIADLYICLFAAANLYEMIPTWLGFIAMGGVTAMAVYLSLLHGMPIALLGLVGGFLTPTLTGTGAMAAPLLFMYLYFVIAGLLVVIRKQAWWMLAVPTLFGAFGWVSVWTFGRHFSSGDTIWLGLFLLAVSGTIIATSRDYYTSHTREAEGLAGLLRASAALNYLALGGGLLLMGMIAGSNNFGYLEWGMYGLLALGVTGLAFFDSKHYGLGPLIAMTVNALMLCSWNYATTQDFIIVLSIFGGIYTFSGYMLQSRGREPLLWGGLVAATSIGYFLIGYFTLQSKGIAPASLLLWGHVALTFAGAAVTVTRQLMLEMPLEHPKRQHMLAVYAIIATTFLSLGLTIELKREFLSVAFAMQVFAVAWISQRVKISALRPLTGLLALIFGFLLLPQVILLLQLTAFSLLEARLHIQESLPIVNWPIFQLGIPAMCFIGASYLLRKQQDGKLVGMLEVSSLILIGIMGYYLARHAFHPDENILFIKAGFAERGALTNIFFVYGLGCMMIGRRLERYTVATSGIVLVITAAFRIIYFDLLLYNPLWATQAVGSWPLINFLLLTYALPIFWLQRFSVELKLHRRQQWEKWIYGLMLLMLFTFISLSLRQLFHGNYLNYAEAGNTEIYSYSIAWLLFGLGLLFYGTLRNDRMTRIASLCVMLLVVGKVFLYDAAALEGLFRVFSFFGLGVSLIGLSWFYTRFVFHAKKEEA